MPGEWRAVLKNSLEALRLDQIRSAELMALTYTIVFVKAFRFGSNQEGQGVQYKAGCA